MTVSQQESDRTHLAPVAVVTGAGSGIGRAVTDAFLGAGFRVALAGRNRDRLVTAAAGREGALPIAADVSVPADVDRLFSETVARWGRVDVLFNNAGVLGPIGMVDEIDLTGWEEAIAVNVTGAMLCAAAAVRIMKQQSPQGGRIINNGSISAHRPRPLSVAYATTKHAMTGLTRSIALDGRAYGITCGQIDIGNTATDMTSPLAESAGALQPDGTRRLEPTFPVGDAARAVLLMAQMPPSATIGSLVITATGMPYDGRG